MTSVQREHAAKLAGTSTGERADDAWCGMRQERIEKADGRYVILYSFDDYSFDDVESGPNEEHEEQGAP
jgi:hypothetical protein